jgi:pimeloyl-ACP methyl ester carboxylesterase
MIHFHGNGEIAADYVPESRGLFEELGVNVLFAEYRGYGASSGTPQFAAMLDDGLVLAEAVGVPPERLVVFGRSVGSIYAIELAARLPVAGLVLESGIADVLQMVRMRVTPQELGVEGATLRDEATRLFDHRAKLGGYRGRLLVLHAQHDHLVPLDQGERNHGWCGAAEKRLVVLPRGDHNTIMGANFKGYWGELRGFVAGVFGG